MERITSELMIRMILESLPLQSGTSFDCQARYFLKQQLMVLVRLSKQEEANEARSRATEANTTALSTAEELKKILH
jgi:hypothetical protein